MDLPSPVIKFKPSQSGLPIKTLPISSATASQAAHIASLTAQVEELVNKNRSISSQHDTERQEWEARLVEERTRAEEVVKRLRDGHKKEVNGLKESLETVRLTSYRMLSGYTLMEDLVDSSSFETPYVDDGICP
jgi:hypothetical protein